MICFHFFAVLVPEGWMDLGPIFTSWRSPGGRMGGLVGQESGLQYKMG